MLNQSVCPALSDPYSSWSSGELGISVSVSEASGSYSNGVIAFPLSQLFVSNSEEQYESSRLHDSPDDSSMLMSNNVFHSRFDTITLLHPKTKVFLKMATLQCVSHFPECFSHNWEMYDCNWTMQQKIQGMQCKKMYTIFIVNFWMQLPFKCKHTTVWTKHSPHPCLKIGMLGTRLWC